jgi:hypothetical protein
MTADYCRIITKERATGESKGQERTNCMLNEFFLVRIMYIETFVNYLLTFWHRNLTFKF